MIACKLSHLAGEMDAAIGKKDLGLANPAGIEDDLPGGRIAGVVLVADAKIVIAQGNPNRFTAPAHMDQPAPERKRAHEGGAGRRRKLGLEAPHKSERSSRDLVFVRHAHLRSVPPRIPRGIAELHPVRLTPRQPTITPAVTFTPRMKSS